jgi:hypothetical protein
MQVQCPTATPENVNQQVGQRYRSHGSACCMRSSARDHHGDADSEVAPGPQVTARGGGGTAPQVDERISTVPARRLQ